MVPEKYGKIDLSKDKSSTDTRFLDMCVSIKETIDKHSPDIIVFEDVSAQRGNVQTLKLLSRLQGFIIGVALANNTPFFILAPSEWRKKLGFKQGAKVKRDELKQQAIEFAKSEFNLENIEEDIAEALCLGFAFLNDNTNLL